MRRVAFVVIIAVLLAAQSTAALAGASRTVERIPESTVVFRDDVGACGAGPGWAIITWKGFAYFLDNPRGTHINVHMDGWLEFVPDDPSVPTEVGHVVVSGNLNLGRGALTDNFLFNVSSRRDDGSRVHLLYRFHVTETPNGHHFWLEFERCLP